MSLWRNIRTLYFKQRDDLRICHLPIWARLRSLEGKLHILYLVYIFLIEKIWEFLFHTKFSYYLRCVMILTLGHIRKFKVYWQKFIIYKYFNASLLHCYLSFKMFDIKFVPFWQIDRLLKFVFLISSLVLNIYDYLLLSIKSVHYFQK